MLSHAVFWLASVERKTLETERCCERPRPSIRLLTCRYPEEAKVDEAKRLFNLRPVAPPANPLMNPAGRILVRGPPAVRADNVDPRWTEVVGGRGGDDAHRTDANAAWEMTLTPPSDLINVPPF